VKEEDCICNIPGVPGAAFVYTNRGHHCGYEIQKCDSYAHHIFDDDALAGKAVIEYLVQRNEVA
jgi:hypothetical protein